MTNRCPWCRYDTSEGTGRPSDASSRGVSPSTSKDGAALTSPWRTFDSVVVTPAALMYVCDLVCGYLWRSDVPAVMKEYVFHLLAQTLRMLRVSEAGMSDMTPSATPQYSPTMSLLQQLQHELKALYEEEVKGFPAATTVSGHGLGLGVADHGRFSTYFQSLLELCLAIAEVTPLHPTPGTDVFASDKCPEATTSLTLLPPASPSAAAAAAAKRKKIKATKRGRSSSGSAEAAAGAEQEAGSPRRDDSASPPPPRCSPVDRESLLSVTSEGARQQPPPSSAKPEEMLWYHRAITMSNILRFVTLNDSQVRNVSSSMAISAAARLIVHALVRVLQCTCS